MIKKGLYKIYAQELFIEALITFLGAGKIHHERFVEKIYTHL